METCLKHNDTCFDLSILSKMLGTINYLYTSLVF